MTIGATSTFTQSRDEICTDALTNLGAVAPGKDAAAARTAGLLTHAARALNRLVKSMDADGQFLWRIVRGTTPLDEGDFNAVLAANVLDIDEPMGVWLQSDASDRTPVLAMSRDDWMVIRHPDTGVPVEVGRPTRYYVEHSQPTGDAVTTVYFDRKSDVDSYNVEYAAFVRGADFTSGATTPNFPSKWVSCLVYGLTAELAPAYKQASLGRQYWDLYNAEKARLLANDTERGNLTLVPFGRGTW